MHSICVLMQLRKDGATRKTQSPSAAQIGRLAPAEYELQILINRSRHSLAFNPSTIRGWNILAVSARFYRILQAPMAVYRVLQCHASVRFCHIPCNFYELLAVSVCFHTFLPYSVAICPSCTKDAQCQLEATAGPEGLGCLPCPGAKQLWHLTPYECVA